MGRTRPANRKTVEIPAHLHEAVAREAQRQGLTTTMAVVEALRTWLVQQEAQGGRIMQDVVPVLGFEKSTEAYDYFSEMFGSEMPTWTLEQLRSWLHEHGHTRYEDITDAVMQEAYEASIA